MTAALSPQIAPALVPTVVLGGEASLVVDKIGPHLQEHGLAVIAHCDWYKARSLVMPEVTRVLFLLTDMVGHHLSVPMVDEARSRGIKVVYGCRKYAVYASRLEAAGFPLLSQSAPLPVAPTIVTTLATLNPPTQEEVPMPPAEVSPLSDTDTLTERVIALLASEPALSGRVVGEWLGVSRYKVEPLVKVARKVLGIVAGVDDVLIQPDTYRAACAARGITPITLPANNIVLRPESSRPGRTRTRRGVLEKAIAHLAKNPLATAKDVKEAIGVNTTTVASATTEARGVLGIEFGRGRSLAVTVDMDKWRKTCEEHGLTEVFPVPQDGVILKTWPTREVSERPASKPAAPPRPARPPRSSLREHPLPQSAVPAAVVAPEVPAGDPLKDVRDLVELLRAEMVKHRIESLTLTAYETKMRRLVVVDESL